jgi:hypothetical protein
LASVTPFLPQLRSGMPDLRTHGQWETDDALALASLSNAIELQGGGGDMLATTSIPDVWAQPLGFLTAWSDRNHPRFERARGEWRGLLAMLALSELLDLGIEILDIDLDDLRRNPWATSESKPAATTGNLAAVLATFKPQARLTASQSWTRLGLLAVQNQPLGLIVPPCLVCPAREHQHSVPVHLDWRDEADGSLVDPCGTGRISSGQASALAIFLKHAMLSVEAIAEAPGGSVDRNCYGTLRSALEEYLSDVYRALPARQNGRRQSDFSVRPVPQGLAGIPYNFLTQAVRPKAAAQGDVTSETVMAVRSEFASEINGVVLVGDEIAKMLGRRPQDLRIWGDHSLSDYLGSALVRQMVAEQAAESSYRVISPADLFNETLAAVEGANARAHPNSAQNYLLPLRPEALRLFTPRALRSGLRISREPGHDAQVELDLPLRASDGSIRTCTLVKHYPEALIRKLPRPTVFATWPNFESEHWKFHYVFHAGDSRAPRPSRFVSPRTLSSQPRAPSTKEQNADSARFPGPPDTELGVLLADHRAEALLCEASDERGVSRDAGLLLLDETTKIAPRDDRWRIGIDFGTTNTSIHYVKVNPKNDAPSRMEFAPRLMAPLGEVDVSKLVLQENFLPHDSVAIPFLSILEERAGESPHTETPLMGRRVHYVRDMALTLDGLAPGKHGRDIRFDLKWSFDPANLSRFESYLKQVCMQSLAELVSMGADPRRVEWSFSQPGSFSSTRADSFREVYDRSVQWVSQNADDESCEPPKICSESVSAAIYFLKNDGIPLGKTVLTLDVGGQTSDICLWHERELLWQTSVHFAGQHIMIPYLASHLEVVSQALQGKLEGKLGITEKLAQLVEGRLAHGLEVVVNSDLFQKAFDVRAGAMGANPLFAGLEHIAEFSLAGLLYYLGTVARHLNQIGQLPSTLDDLRICLGGRGSLVFKSVLDRQAEYHELFGKVAGLQIGNLSFHRSRDPKLEVSFGMLVPPGGAGDVNIVGRYPKCILGEKIEIGRKSKQALDVLELGDEDAIWKIKELPEFEAFLGLYRQTFGRSLSIDPAQRRDLIGRVENDVVDLRQTLKSDQRRSVNRMDQAEPIFIFPLRQFVLMMNKSGEMIS